ncbi:LysR substrate-binding domain-containing protein [Roseomonas sp. CCTCC AB2023176]|uniref:LysR substrate-binding domain-containing protein n=1 Tax=Roseomonas sp. CCTCC AB2023176 TaxID=3342640 RepID=UPI0035D6C091
MGPGRRLPPLNGLRAFEAAARTGGFAAAAKEMNVSPAAVSRLVQLLEARLGVALFERTANRLMLTDAGARYGAGLTPLLDGIAALTEGIAGTSSRVLTVGVGPTFAVRWLIPRLAEFGRVAPEVEVRIATGGAAVPFAEDWTCGIRLGTDHPPGLPGEALFRADLTPVCAPSLAARLRSPADLRGETLLRVAHAEDDWPRWWNAAGEAPVRAGGPVLPYYGQAQQAAADGLGVALGLRPYVDDDLRDGRLVAPFTLTVPKGAWFLVFRERRATEPAFRAFRDWITTAARAAAEPSPPRRPRARRAR